MRNCVQCILHIIQYIYIHQVVNCCICLIWLGVLLEINAIVKIRIACIGIKTSRIFPLRCQNDYQKWKILYMVSVVGTNMYTNTDQNWNASKCFCMLFAWHRDVNKLLENKIAHWLHMMIEIAAREWNLSNHSNRSIVCTYTHNLSDWAYVRIYDVLYIICFFVCVLLNVCVCVCLV